MKSCIPSQELGYNKLVNIVIPGAMSRQFALSKSLDEL